MIPLGIDGFEQALERVCLSAHNHLTDVHGESADKCYAHIVLTNRDSARSGIDVPEDEAGQLIPGAEILLLNRLEQAGRDGSSPVSVPISVSIHRNRAACRATVELHIRNNEDVRRDFRLRHVILDCRCQDEVEHRLDVGVGALTMPQSNGNLVAERLC